MLAGRPATGEPADRQTIRARWKQSKRFNFGRRCNITVPSEMESQPLSGTLRAGVRPPAPSRSRRRRRWRGRRRRTLPNCSGGPQRRRRYGRRLASYALRMNFDARSWAQSAAHGRDCIVGDSGVLFPPLLPPTATSDRECFNLQRLRMH